MKKIYIKIILDIIMTILFVLMFKKNVISLTFHEIGGLIVLGLFIFHKILNSKWIKNVTCNLFNKKLNIKIRICYLVDVLLLISMTLIAVSGFFISKVLFNSNGSQLWRNIHYICADLSLALVGIHVGLHYYCIVIAFKRIFKISKTPVYLKVVSYIIAALIMLYGFYNIAARGIFFYSSAPLGMTNNMFDNKGEFLGEGRNFEGNRNFNNLPQNGSQQNQDPNGSIGNLPQDGNQQNQDPSGSIGNLPQDRNQSKDSNTEGANGLHQRGSQRPQFPNGNRGGIGNGRGMGNGKGTVFSVIASYGSIIFAFSFITAILEKLLRKISCNKSA